MDKMIRLALRQNGIYYKLVKEFQKITSTPMDINTSFNLKGKPIICTPEETYARFLKTKMDCLVLGNCVVEKGQG